MSFDPYATGSRLAPGLAAGRAVQLMSPIQGSGRSTELSWLVVGAPGSTVTLEAASPTTGRAKQTITLRAR